MEIHFLGTGDAFGNDGKFQTCIKLNWSGGSILLDCGSTTNVALHSNKVNLNSIKAIVLTHFHGDHFGGIPYFLLDAQWNSKRDDALIIAGPVGVEEKVRALMEVTYPSIALEDMYYPLEFVEYRTGATFDLLDLQITTYPMLHSAPSLPHGLRIQQGDKVVAFTGDTGWTEEIIPLAAEADVLITECAGLDSTSPRHLNYETLQKNLERITAKQIVLTHITDSSGLRASNNICLAQDNFIIQA